MDLSALPTLYSLLVFLCCLRPLVQRAGPHTHAWFHGWTFLLIHYLCLFMPQGPGGVPVLLVHAVSLWSLDAGGFCFLWAASDARLYPAHRIFLGELTMPVLLQSGLLLLGLHGHGARIVIALLFLAPGLHLWLRGERYAKGFPLVAALFAALGVGIAVPRQVNGELVAQIILGAVLLSAAYMTFRHATRMTRGVVLMVAGLASWSLTSPLQAFDMFSPAHSVLTRGVMSLPRYVLAAGIILAFLDEYLSQTEKMALHDPLTGLPNRRLFEYRFGEAMGEARRTGKPVACLVIDVDDFKYINDTFGHPVGDGLLQALAKRLSWNLGPRDMLARTGGDEFSAVIVDAADEYHVRFVAGAMMAAGCVPVSIEKHAIDVHISIGIAISPANEYDSAKLHKTADTAMYYAKKRGGGVIAFAGEEVQPIHLV